MKRYYFIFCWFICILLISCGNEVTGKGGNNGNEGGEENPHTAQLGKVLPDWSEGYLDIHAINTGRGECSLLIFPDGTTMMVDAASSATENEAEEDSSGATPIKPANTQPVETIIHYVSHFIEAASGRLDYLMLSHWHADHIGGPPDDSKMETHPEGNFILCGVTRVGTEFPVGKLIDRGSEIGSSFTAMNNYFKYVDWVTAKKGTVREKAQVGNTTQIVLKVKPEAYPKFTVRNITANGVVWTGEGTDGSRNTFSTDPAELSKVGENKLSIGFLLSYGNFDFFSGGDVSYSGRSTTGSWVDIEASLSKIIRKIEVMKASHHGTKNCNSDEFLKVAKPDAVMIHVWQDVQPNPSTINRFFSANSDCNIFTTNLTERNKGVLGTSTVAKLKSTSGHIVVRVDPGGNQYYVYILNDNNENYIVQRILGPYDCK